MKTDSSLELLESRIAPSTLLVTNLNDAGSGSLRAAIAGSHNGDVINFKTGLTGFIHVKTQMNITDSITINGGGKITLDGVTVGDYGTRFFNIDDGKSNVTEQVKITGLTMRDGNVFDPNGLHTGNNGGAIQSEEALTVANCTFIGNAAQIDGGAIFAGVGSQLTVQNSTFAKNFSGYEGTAIYATQAKSVNITGVAFSNNGGGTGGFEPATGALYIDGTTAGYTLANSTFHANISSTYVPAAILYGNGTITNCNFSANSNLEEGGSPGGWQEGTPPAPAVLISVAKGQSVKISNTVFDHNTAGISTQLGIEGLGTVTQTNVKFL
jgi:hypothetical protein